MTIRLNDGRVVSMLTDNRDGTVTVRLSPRDGQERSVRLREPNALEYAELRVAMVDIDRRLEDEFPIPLAPDVPDGISNDEAGLIVQRYADARTKYLNARNEAIKDPEKAPYAFMMIEVIGRLNGETVVLADLPRGEPFSATPCSALLEVWEAPLDGPDDRDENQPRVPAIVAPVPDSSVSPPAGTEPGSSEPEPSSLPTTEPASLSLPPPSIP